MTRVSKELAQMLKIKGYDVPTSYRYFERDGEMHEPITPMRNNWNATPKCTSRPTLAAVAQWLRERHNMHVCIDMYESKWFWVIRNATTGFVVTYSGVQEKRRFDAHDEALSAGIEHSLKLIP